jgi:hypothetical protein
MKTETAKGLAWLDTKSFGMSGDVPYIPSVEEMLREMTKYVSISISIPSSHSSVGGLVGVSKDVYPPGRYGKKVVEGDQWEPIIGDMDLSDALAQLCIWLRDNKLMDKPEGKEGEHEGL